MATFGTDARTWTFVGGRGAEIGATARGSSATLGGAAGASCPAGVVVSGSGAADKLSLIQI